MKTFKEFILECYYYFNITESQAQVEAEFQAQLAQAHYDLTMAKRAQRDAKIVRSANGTRIPRQNHARFFGNNPEEKEQQDQIKAVADQRQADALANIDALINPQPQVEIDPTQGFPDQQQVPIQQ